MLSLSTFCLWGITQHIVVAHHIAFAMDMGYSSIYASSVLSLFGVFFSLGCLISFISDQIGREFTLTIGGVFIVSGILILMFIKDNTQPWMLYYYATAVGFGIGMTTPPIAAATTDIFQGPRAGAIIGFIWLSFAVGGSIGPWLGGWVFELTRSYKSAFILAIVICALGCGGMWWAAPRKIRQVQGRVMIRNDV